MIQDYFHLQRQPFTSVPSPKLYFPASSIESARASLVRMVERTEGPALVIGPVGTGKTLLCQVLAESFQHRCSVVTMPSGRLPSRRTLLQSILFELRLPYREMDEGELRLSLIDHVTNPDACPHGILLLVDEGENLNLALLDELRSLTNLTCDGLGCVRLAIFGSPRLEEKFTHPRLESFNQRLAGRFYLESFDTEETGQYIQQMFSDCGGNSQETFTRDALHTIHQACGGIPRLVNQLTDHALVLTATGSHELVNSACVEEAWADLQQLPMPGSRPSHEQSSSMPEDIVEFGQLEDIDEGNVGGDVKRVPEESGLHPSTVRMDEPPFSEDSPTTSHSSDVDTLDGEISNDELPGEKIPSDVDDSEVTLVFHSSSNPFGDDFEEEEIVVDTFVSPDALAQRHRRQVEAEASDHLARRIFQLRQQPATEDGESVADAYDEAAAELLTAEPVHQSTGPLLIEDKTEDRHEHDVASAAEPDETKVIEDALEDFESDRREIIYLGDHTKLADSSDAEQRTRNNDTSEQSEIMKPSETEGRETGPRAPHNYSTLFSRLRRRHG